MLRRGSWEVSSRRWQLVIPAFLELLVVRILDRRVTMMKTNRNFPDGKYGRQTTVPPGEVAAKTSTKSRFDIPGAKQVKLRHGPYLVPGMNRQNSFSKHWGMLESYYDTKIDKPCSDCNILYQIGGLEYANGTNANIDSGLW